MIWSKDRLGGIILTALFIIYGWRSGHIELLPIQQASALTAATVPYTLTVLGILGGAWLIWRPVSSEPPSLSGLYWPRLFAFLVLMSCYGLALRPAGFLLASTVFVACGFRLLGERRVLPLLTIATALPLAFWALMTYVLGVYLPPLPGALGDI